MSSLWPLRDTVEVSRAVVEDEQTATLPPDLEPPPGAPIEEPPTDRDLWPWLVVLLVLVIAALVGAWLATRNRDGSSTVTTATTGQAIAPAPTGPAKKPTGTIVVPRLVGLKAPAALEALRTAGITGATHGVFSTRPRNEVVAQKPAAGVKVGAGATVAFDVSKGTKPIPVPDVTGQQVAAAIATLRAQDLRANIVRVPSDQPTGQVVAQHPRAGATSPSSTAVRLNVSVAQTATSTGPAPAAAPRPKSKTPPVATPVAVPDVRGLKINEARKLLHDEGLVTEVRQVPNALPKHTVVAQSPTPDSSAKRGDHVLVTVSLGAPKATAPAQAAVPDVTGEDESTAIEDLEAAGFNVKVVDQDTTDQAEDGLVLDQDPFAGRRAVAKSTVTIYVGRFSG